jgi:ABC-type antimicrobial peptide transport system permease subunit
LVWLFAILAFALSAAGIYGVLSYTVAAREKEFGIRIALGGERGRVLRRVLAQGGLLIGAGLAIGILGALALTRFLRALLYEVTPTGRMPIPSGEDVVVGTYARAVGLDLIDCCRPGEPFGINRRTQMNTEQQASDTEGHPAW